jgi:spermidine synthase
MRHARSVLPGLAAALALAAAAPAQPVVLYEKESPYNTVIVTEDAAGLRTLQFERYGARQSVVKIGDPDHLELPYIRTVLVSLALVEEPKRVLVIGLGGGTIPSFLHRHFPEMTIDAVDIDPEVVEVARRFFEFREDDRLRGHVADGRKFIEDCEQPYDVIILDAFGSDSIPEHLATAEFLQAVRRALTPGGIAVGNIWSRGSNPLYDSMVRTYRSVFDQVRLLDVADAGNIIVLAVPRPDPIRRADVVRRAGALSKQKGFAFDLSGTARYGFRSERTRTEGGRILRD